MHNKPILTYKKLFILFNFSLLKVYTEKVCINKIKVACPCLTSK